ncbi:unnamed protein product [Polarella glacialis]|uniref:Neutral ceramidase n=1 Tax=Polarella glacialis TaxID=89957 RepID=A0A813H1X3_POLGL|nr:unnamed protein product [Polarella glacialis]
MASKFSREDTVKLDGLAVGCGSYDITGPVAEVGMMGYGNLRQKAAGLHIRLRSRAFIFLTGGSRSRETRFVFVSTDLWSCTEAVKTEVVEGLQEIFGPSLYTRQNVMISATHTHSGPGGFSGHAFYNFTVLGFQRENFNCICKGIVRSIVRAHAQLKDVTCVLSRGTLQGVCANRSQSAYLRNPKEERHHYGSDVDEEVTLMRFDTCPFAGLPKPLGLISWFGVHPTSMDRKNDLVTGDSKGVAGYLFERRLMGADYRAPDHFVAAFAQRAALGDVTPNGGANGEGSNFTRTNWSGMRQFENTRELWETAGRSSSPDGEALRVCELRYAHVFVDFAQIDIEVSSSPQVLAPPAASDAAAEVFASRSAAPLLVAAAAATPAKKRVLRTATAAIGASAAAGSTFDGPSGMPGVAEGQTKSPSVIYDAARELLARTSPELRQAHSPKPLLLATGLMDPPWTPHVLPLQIFGARAASPQRWAFVLVAVPFELSTMAGRRLRTALRDVLSAPESCPIVLCGLANAYAGYCVTFEEYQQQQYEGAMTMFGPNTLSALIQEMCRLAQTLLLQRQQQSNQQQHHLQQQQQQSVRCRLAQTLLLQRQQQNNQQQHHVQQHQPRTTPTVHQVPLSSDTSSSATTRKQPTTTITTTTIITTTVCHNSR